MQYELHNYNLYMYFCIQILRNKCFSWRNYNSCIQTIILVDVWSFGLPTHSLYFPFNIIYIFKYLIRHYGFWCIYSI